MKLHDTWGCSSGTKIPYQALKFLIMAVRFMHPCKVPQNGWVCYKVPKKSDVDKACIRCKAVEE